MALYWHDQKVVLDIVDDPLGEHVNESRMEGWKIIRTTREEISSVEGMRRLGDELALALGQEPSEKTPEWLAGNERLASQLGLFAK